MRLPIAEARGAGGQDVSPAVVDRREVKLAGERSDGAGQSIVLLSASIANPAYPYRWAWSRRPMDRDRKGQRCRVVARGAMNSAEVEFEDGARHITSRNGLRKAS